jgi:HEAT repeat protein
MASGDTVTIRREAAAWLGRHAHPDAVQALERALRDDSSATLRSQAARSLARVASADVAVTALVRAARTDPEQAVRRSAVQALGGVADDRAAAALAGLISDPGESAPTSVRREAVTQFGQRARSGPAPAATVELLQRISRNDSEAAVRLQAVESLLRLPDVATISFLVGLVNDHPDTRVQQRAVQAIARTEPSSDAAAALRRLAWEHSRLDVQRYATRALVQVGTDDARRLLADIAERHPHADVRRSALQAIVTLDTR